MIGISRRDLLKTGLSLGSGVFLCPGLLGRAYAAKTEDPHFFLLALLPGGFDPTYMFDSRPLDQAQPEGQHNYQTEAATLLTGSNGQSAWMGSASKGLQDLFPYFSIVNGVMMSAQFDGHSQNLNTLLTGNPFGGEFFAPEVSKRKSVGSLANSYLSGSQFANGGKVVVLGSNAISKVAAHLKTSPEIRDQDPELGFLSERLTELGGGRGLFSKGASAMKAGLESSMALADTLRAIPEGSVDPNKPFDAFVETLLAFYKKGITGSGVIDIVGTIQIDTHDTGSAKAQPASYRQIADRIRTVIQKLRTTPYDSQRSFYDVTTFMVASEFSRTRRQKDRVIADTGTDHNNISNSILLGGKSIKGGMVLGASDFATLNETVSGAHKTLDPDFLKVMGRPFDFTQMRPRADLPGQFLATDYITTGSVANTIYELFQVEKRKYWSVLRNGQTDPVLSALISATS
ncbi:MAG: DUF1501 domain-containing protein [Bdellovibrionales bacterium]|nr:DUF1501 domain-containing protein [Bdellovibrionales bacterium]